MAPKGDTSTVGFRGVEVRPLSRKAPGPQQAAPGPTADFPAPERPNENNGPGAPEPSAVSPRTDMKEEVRERQMEPSEVWDCIVIS